MTHKISGCDLDWSEAPHDLNASFFWWSDKNAALAVWVLTSGYPWVLEWPFWFALKVLESRMSRRVRWKGRLQRGIDEDDCRWSCYVER